jgi:glutathione synthase/RimK-type ligase-like ATP-grasp enzyme
MWHWSHSDYRAQNFARQLIMSIERMGIRSFPNYNNCWHFDDKIGQKYLLEAIGASIVPSYVFYDKDEAIEWVNSTLFPKVFKLRGGASSLNVRLVKNIKNRQNTCQKSI